MNLKLQKSFSTTAIMIDWLIKVWRNWGNGYVMLLDIGCAKICVLDAAEYSSGSLMKGFWLQSDEQYYKPSTNKRAWRIKVKPKSKKVRFMEHDQFDTTKKKFDKTDKKIWGRDGGYGGTSSTVLYFIPLSDKWSFRSGLRVTVLANGHWISLPECRLSNMTTDQMTPKTGFHHRRPGGICTLDMHPSD